MFHNCLRHAGQQTLQEVRVTRRLNFNDEDFAVFVLRLDVNTVELVVLVLLVALAFENRLYLALHAQYDLNETFKDGVVRLVRQKFLDGIVEADEFVACHSYRTFNSFDGKDRRCFWKLQKNRRFNS